MLGLLELWRTRKFLFLFYLSDLCGSEDGSIRLWEFGRSSVISSHRGVRVGRSVTMMHFTPQGNKVNLLERHVDSISVGHRCASGNLFMMMLLADTCVVF